MYQHTFSPAIGKPEYNQIETISQFNSQEANAIRDKN